MEAPLETACYRIKLKPGSLPKVEEWAKRLTDEKSEVSQLLKNEGVQIESVFLEDTQEGAFLIYYLRALDIEKAQSKMLKSNHPIDIFHREVMSQVVESSETLNQLVELTGLKE